MPPARARFGWVQYLSIWIVEALVALPIAFIWYMSPLGLGFKTWPEGARGEAVSALFQVSYFGGIGSVLLSLIIAPILFAFGRTRLAIWSPIIALGALITGVLAVLLLFE